jgi:hypothetical protein
MLFEVNQGRKSYDVEALVTSTDSVLMRKNSYYVTYSDSIDIFRTDELKDDFTRFFVLRLNQRVEKNSHSKEVYSFESKSGRIKIYKYN